MCVGERGVGRHQSGALVVGIPDAVPVRVEEGRSCEICMPLLDWKVSHIESRAATHSHWSGKTIDDLIVPLIEGSNSPVTIWNSIKREVALGVAFGKREVFTVHIAKTHVALREAQGVVRSAAI